MNPHPLNDAIAAAGGRVLDVAGVPMAMDYGEPRAEYAAALNAVALFDARDRGLIEVTGNDRAAWLHNLVTNAVKTLRPGDGNYAFASNVQGRILFDCNILVLADRIWMDVDRRYVVEAMAHLDRYIITEDVQLADRSDAFCRMVLLGPQVAGMAKALGASHAAALPSVAWSQVKLGDSHRFMFRNDARGTFALELCVERHAAADCWERLMDLGRPTMRPIGWTAMEVLRIEAGIPAYGADIDEDVLPAETQQIERAISYVKGCYLGQEVVERMRSRGSLARRLVGLELGGNAGAPLGAQLAVDGAGVGRLTSLCESYATGGTIGLGYVKTAHAAAGTVLQVEASPRVEATVRELPFRK